MPPRSARCLVVGSTHRKPFQDRSGRLFAWSQRRRPREHAERASPGDWRLIDLRQLHLQAPAPVIAQALGYYDKSITRIATESGAPWRTESPSGPTISYTLA